MRADPILTVVAERISDAIYLFTTQKAGWSSLQAADATIQSSLSKEQILDNPAKVQLDYLRRHIERQLKVMKIIPGSMADLSVFPICDSTTHNH